MAPPEPSPQHLFKFPPFPPIPEGTTILPFSSFKETGIQISPGNSGEEVDALGIPTVGLRVPHDTDECKTAAKRSNSIKKKPEEKAPPVPVTEPKRIYYDYSLGEWWEQWAEGEDSRGTPNAYNPNVSRMDRIHQASTDFRMNRIWPPLKSQVPYLWDQIRLYIGLLGMIPIWHRTDLATPAQASTSDPISDDDDYDDSDTENRNVYQTQQDEEQQRRPFKRFHVRPPYALYGAVPVKVDSDQAVQRLLEDEKARKEERLLSFLNDPEKSVKVFLSSYMRAQGLIWSATALNTLPRLFVFFLTFLLRNRVLPEPTHERALNKALEVAKQAVDELPKTGRVCKALPDKLGMSGTEKFGARRRALDKENSKDDDSDVEHDLIEKFEAELKAANVEVLKVNDIVPPEPASPSSPKSPPPAAKPTTTSGAPNWAALATADRNTTPHSDAAPNWANAPDPTPNWADAPDPTPGNPNPNWASDATTKRASILEQWAVPAAQVDPEISRYRCGVAERSMRRVKDMAKPAPKPNSNDRELANRYAKVVLAPWGGGEWDDGGEAPEFRKACVIPPPSELGDALEEYNAEEGDITLLVEPHALGSLCVGMGLAGTWVQLVPLASGCKSKKAKGKGERFWYMEELTMGIPSFWTIAGDPAEEGVCEDAYADF